MLGSHQSNNSYNNKDVEPHEVFIDNLAQKKEDEIGGSKKKMEVSLSSPNLNLFFFIAFFCLVVLLGRSFQLQFFENESYAFRAQRNMMSISQAQLLRGIIYDREGTQLAYNLPQYDLKFQNRQLSSLTNNCLRVIANIVGENPQEIYDKIKESESSTITIKRGLEHEEVVRIEAALNSVNGFYIESSAGRNYYHGDYFSHIIGYIGKIDRETLLDNPEKYTIHDYVGKMGVEKYYEEELSRSGERTEIIRDAQGNILEENIIAETEAGENIVLTIDARLQDIVARQTKERLEEIDGKKAAVVIMNPQNGEILSLFSTPAYDNNLFRERSKQDVLLQAMQDEDAVFLNRVTSAGYPTGSVIKPLLAAAALEEGIISPEKKILSRGYISIPNPWNPSQPTIFRDYHVHGWRDMREAIAVSSNVYFYAIGGGYEDQEGLGSQRMNEYLSLFGWGERTGIDLPGEIKGVVPSSDWKEEVIGDAWRIGDSYNLSIGQGYLEATPLQVANSFAALVNGGKLFKPHVLKKVTDDEGNVVAVREPEIIREDIIAPENLKVVKEGMRMATTMGTARSLQVLPVTSGAKTGTAQTSRPGMNNNWVAAFAPYEDPEIVITVIIEEREGVTPVATHLARDIMMEYLSEPEGEVEEKEVEED